MANYTMAEHLNVIKGFCDKSDGKDKLTALVQYVCMFLSANEPGNIKKIQASVTAARKVFRIMRPLETITPLLISPGFNAKDPKVVQLINKIKTLLMATYFGADHFVWAFQIGLITDKKVGEKWQKLSLYSWALGSLCTVLAEGINVAGETPLVKKENESEDDFKIREAAEAKARWTRKLTIIHAVVQALLAAGLLQTLPLKPRTTGFLGVVASAMNCYFLLPAYPKQVAKAKTA